MIVLFLEVTLDSQTKPSLNICKRSKHNSRGNQAVRMRDRSRHQDPRVMLIESTWNLELPEIIDGFPIKGLKCRRWSFHLL